LAFSVENMSVRNHIWQAQTNAPPERRRSGRMAIQQDVHYRILNKKEGDIEANGKTVDMSSSGVLFTTDHILLPGRRVELSINWPAQLDNKCALKLVARGRVVRFERGTAAIEILQHEFRTRRSI
jgi:c-di-GMP-binding flagellar brake protein YcgR